VTFDESLIKPAGKESLFFKTAYREVRL